jgi:hypothetical protein
MVKGHDHIMLCRERKKSSRYGESNATTRLTEDQAREVRIYAIAFWEARFLTSGRAA